MNILRLDCSEDIPENYTGIVDYHDGDIHYYLNGLHHRVDGPAVIYTNGLLMYYLNGKRHREDGPAIIWNSNHKEYYLNGKLHREDGPARIYSNGTKSYYLNGNNITEEVNNWLSGKTNIPPYKKWDNDTRLIFKLTFG